MFLCQTHNMFLAENKPIITDSGPFYYSHEITLTVRRLDLMDPVSGGNKWFKLRYNLKKFFEGNYSGILTYGGAFSNHIAAVAKAGNDLKISTIGIIRGEDSSLANKTLIQARNNGMQLIFISRSEYRNKYDKSFLEKIIPDYQNYFILEEGGANAEGVKGCAEILDPADNTYNHIAVACGTGTTAAGMLLAMKSGQKLIGFSILRDNGFIEKEITNWLTSLKSHNSLPLWEINHDYDFGGYAKTNDELTLFCKNFYLKTQIEIEPLYTGKMFYGLEQLIATGHFKPGSNILAIHSGGMQYI